ncbi:hypothetical protein [Roseibacillus ishigakijimensis]|uniref:Uncharacterized protein n=1 Tax=Roseibacillus ishigakijimensis TaxID=454146 RepID=A0A934RMR6_9BACT|nr:hypothetical protein [Roseibacillus ishigakijimensis]MBK1834254.1 hypothetical protein [Roseibacillus ishigakijimensis]
MKSALLPIALLPIALLFAFLLPLAGQEEPEEQPKTLIRALAFEARRIPAPLYAHSPSSQGAEGVELEVKSYLNHVQQELPLSKNVILTTSADPASVEDDKLVVGKTALPDNTQSVILILLPAKSEGGGQKFHLLPIPDSLRDFPKGSFTVINLSPADLRITLEKSGFEIGSMKAKLIEDPPVNARNASAMTAWSNVGGEWEKFSSSSWAHPGGKREIQIAYMNPRNQRLDIKGIKDIAIPGDE